MMRYLILAALAASVPTVLSSNLAARQDCSPDFKLCMPKGAKVHSLGEIGSDWADLYTKIVNVVGQDKVADHPVPHTTDPSGPGRREAEQAFCCSVVADCLLLPDYDIPMCWDRFTTNVFFPDGTYGTVVSGDFQTSGGDQVDLIYGDYTLKNGTSGNIYNGGGMSSMRPDTSTLDMPLPWTSSGEGSAIPATGLGTTGSVSIGTTTIPASTIFPSTGSSVAIIATVTGCGHCPAYNTTIAGPTGSGGFRPPNTSVFTSGIITPSMTGSKAATYQVNIARCSVAIAMIMACIFA